MDWERRQIERSSEVSCYVIRFLLSQRFVPLKLSQKINTSQTLTDMVALTHIRSYELLPVCVLDIEICSHPKVSHYTPSFVSKNFLTTDIVNTLNLL